MEAVSSRVAQVMNDEGNCIGTVARVTQDGLCVSCRDVFVSGDGQFINARAWNEPLEFVASWPYHDIIFVKGVTMVGGMQLGWYAVCICLFEHC